MSQEPMFRGRRDRGLFSTSLEKGELNRVFEEVTISSILCAARSSACSREKGFQSTEEKEFLFDSHDEGRMI